MLVVNETKCFDKGCGTTWIRQFLSDKTPFVERDDLVGSANARLRFRATPHHVHQVADQVSPFESRHQVNESDRPLTGDQGGLHLFHHPGVRLDELRTGTLERFQVGHGMALRITLEKCCQRNLA